MSPNFRTVEDTLYVGNLPFSVTEEDLRKLFTSNGHTTVGISLVTNYKSGRSRGFGFVRMASVDAADSALALDGAELEGRKVSVSKGREKTLRRPTSR